MTVYRTEPIIYGSKKAPPYFRRGGEVPSPGIIITGNDPVFIEIFLIIIIVSIQNEAHGDWHLVRRSPNKRACPYVRHSSSE